MWEVLNRAPRGRISLRNLSLLATGILVAILLNLGITHTALADDVKRTTDGFVYQGKPFGVEVKILPGDPRNLATTATGEVTAYENLNPERTKAEYIYFAKGVDPKTATTALYTTFDYKAPDTYSNQSPSPPQTVNISAEEPVLSSQNSGNNSCGIPSIGWILCPVGGFIAWALDGMYDLMIMFLDVKPMIAGGPIYDIWSAIRSLANIVFVIVFLIIIFSQVTSLGISAYSLRKMLPRLVVAAILVNTSFIISALAVDLSNYLGHSVYAMISSLAKSLDTAAVNISWADLTTVVLAGSGAVSSVAIGHQWLSAVTAGSGGAATFTLLGMLISVALAVLTALIILFVRQALIIIFVIVSPLALVAMVLPSTEGLYKKWQKAFLSMLLMFPIFALVFSGAMVAGAAIIASSDGNIFLVILGKGVQLLPLAITPIIVRFSTGILGTIAKFTNDKNKGLIDRAKNWTNDQAEHHRKKSLAGRAGWNAQRSGLWWNPWRNTAQAFDTTSRRQKLEQQGFEDAADARAKGAGTGRGAERRLSRYRNAYNYTNDMKADNETRDNLLKGDYDNRRRTDSDTVIREIGRRQAEAYAKKESESLERMHANIVAEGASNLELQQALGNVQNAEIRNMTLAQANQIKLDIEEVAFSGIAKKMAERTHQDNISNILEDNTRMINGNLVRAYAGGIQGEQGEKAALAYAVSLKRKQFGESVSEMNELYKHYAPDSGAVQDMIVGRAQTAQGIRRDSNGNITSKFDFNRDDIYAMEAALETNIAIGTVSMVDEILAMSGSGLAEYRTTISSALAKAGHSGRSIYQGGRLINEVSQGRIQSSDDLTSYVQKQILDGKFSAAQLANLDAPAAERFVEAATRPPIDPNINLAEFNNSLRRLARKVDTAIRSEQTSDTIKENTAPYLRQLHALDSTLPSLPPDF